MSIDTLDRAHFYLAARKRQAMFWPTMPGAARSDPKMVLLIIHDILRTYFVRSYLITKYFYR